MFALLSQCKAFSAQSCFGNEDVSVWLIIKLCIFCNTKAPCFLTVYDNIKCLPSESTVSSKIFRMTKVKEASQGDLPSSW